MEEKAVLLLNCLVLEGDNTIGEELAELLYNDAADDVGAKSDLRLNVTKVSNRRAGKADDWKSDVDEKDGSWPSDECLFNRSGLLDIVA